MGTSDERRTGRVISRTLAAARLRLQAREHLEGAIVALDRGAGDERTRQAIDGAVRRLVAAGRIEQGDVPRSVRGLIEAHESPRPEPPRGGVSAGRGWPLPAASLERRG